MLCEDSRPSTRCLVLGHEIPRGASITGDLAAETLFGDGPASFVTPPIVANQEWQIFFAGSAKAERLPLLSLIL